MPRPQQAVVEANTYTDRRSLDERLTSTSRSVDERQMPPRQGYDQMPPQQMGGPRSGMPPQQSYGQMPPQQGYGQMQQQQMQGGYPPQQGYGQMAPQQQMQGGYAQQPPPPYGMYPLQPPPNGYAQR